MRSLILTLLFFVVSVSEGSGAQLNRISTSESAISTQIFAYFDELPLYQERISARRLDLTLFDTRAAELLPTPQPNAVIIKTLVVQERDDARLSMFFRYAPQELSITGTPDGTLIIDLIPGNRFTGAYRELGSSLGLLTQVKPGQQTLISPLTFSPYKDDWRSFFEEFDDLPILTPVPAPSLPPFPLAALVSSGEARKVPFIEELDGKDMFDSLQQVQKRLKSISTEEERKYYAITHAEILFRLGSVEAALSQYKLLADTYGNDEAGNLSAYGAALLEIGTRRFHLARVRLENLLERLPVRHPLTPHVRLAVAETLLATRQYNEMRRLFDREDFPASLSGAIEVRQADLAQATGRFNEAFTIYEKFYGTTEMAARPHSINGYCSILFSRRDYGKSKRCYLDLAAMLSDRNEAGSAHYLAALAELKAGDGSASPEILFGAITERYPGTEAALLAEMKQADICSLAPVECTENPSQWYHRIADRASSRTLAESASFKEALSYFLAGQKSTSIDLLQRMLRTYQSGELLDQARALLIQLLPSEIERLLDSGLEIEAIALAQQNRSFFEKGWLADALLFQIGLAFENLGMHPEALRLFLYLKNRTASRDEESLLFATIRSAHALGTHPLVEDLSSEYRYRYPQGAHALDVLFYRLDCTYAVGRIDEALLMLPDPPPQRLDFLVLEAALNFQKQRYRRTADLLLPVYQTQQKDLTDDQLYMLAESLFELGNLSTCRELFELLAETAKYKRAAGHRLMQLAGSQDREQSKQWDEFILADEAQSDPWQRFAAQDSRYRQLLSNL
jgi:tetratricopeptide (TPR) repeat protein